MKSDESRLHRDPVSIVVVTYHAGPMLHRCLESLFDRQDVATCVVVVDNGETGQVEDDLTRAFPSVLVVNPGRNLGFAAGANRGLAAAAVASEWVALINPDTVVPPGVLGQLIGVLQSEPSVAAVAPRLISSDGGSQPYSFGGEPTPWYLLRRQVARAFGRTLHDWAAGRPRAVDWVSGACLVIRRTALEKVGALDERFFLYFEDVDWCRRCREAGWSIWFVPEVAVRHDSQANYRDRARRTYNQASLAIYYDKYYRPFWSLAMRLATQAGIAG